MKVQIDTTAKTIKVDQKVNLKDFSEFLDKVLPNDEWKEYDLEANTVIQSWGNPINIYRDRWPTYPYWNNPYVVNCNSNSGTYSTAGTPGISLTNTNSSGCSSIVAGYSASNNAVLNFEVNAS